jgi:putative transposase
MPKRKHLQRLSYVFQNHPRYFVTACVYNRRNLLADPVIHEILRKHWTKSLDLYGWVIGSYVVMPDHVHFFCADAEAKKSLSRMVGAWKEWSSKEICFLLGMQAPLWQKEFFDHLIRSNESYSEKWEYIIQNPVRGGLVIDENDWEYAGYIHYV